jgi:hypothetical protein
MIFRFVDYPILGLNLGFEISDICRRAIRRSGADAPCAVFALLCPNRQVRIYVAHEAEYALIRLDRKRRAGCLPGTFVCFERRLLHVPILASVWVLIVTKAGVPCPTKI